METQNFYGEDLPMDGLSMAPAERIEAGAIEVYLDLETLPAGEPPAPEEIRPPSNFKDPSKIAAYQQERVDEVFRARALNPLEGQVLTIGWAVGGDPARSLTVGLECENERTLFDQFQVEMVRATRGREVRWIGHNLASFDLAWLWKRSFIHKADRLRAMIPRAKFTDLVVDTMRLFSFDYRDNTSLGTLASFLGIGGKSGGLDGSKIYDAWLEGRLEEIAAYCRQDVELTRTIHNILTQ